MNQTLHTIQTFAKIGKIISCIIKIGCIVGAVMSIIGMIFLAVIPNGSSEAAVQIHGLLELSEKTSAQACYGYLTAGLILSIGEGTLAYIAERYFRHELQAGTPFTLEGAREMFRLGICTMAIPLGTVIAAQTGAKIVAVTLGGTVDPQIDGFISMGLGLAFIAISFLLRYCAEKETQTYGECLE